MIVYKKNGPHWGPCGTTYDSKEIEDEAYATEKATGWDEDFLTALGLKEQPLVLEEDLTPTRAEMIQKAEQLNIKIDGRWSDKKLLSAIDEALKEQK